MTGDDNAPPGEPRPAAQSSQDPEKTQSETETEHGQPEREPKQGHEEQPLPQLPPRPPQKVRSSVTQQTLGTRKLPPLPLSGIPFGPVPGQQVHEQVNTERPDFPTWHWAKVVLGAMSLVASAIILAIGVALGFHNAPYYIPDTWFVPIDVELGTSGAAAGLAILVTTIDFLKICLSSKRRGLHPGMLVAFHLFTWLMALVAVIMTALFMDGNSYYDYPSADEIALESQNAIYEQVLIAFDSVLLFVHLVIFIGACVETNKVDSAKRKVVVVRVPVPAGAPFPGGVYPIQRSPGAVPVPPQTAALYGGYYAPAAPELVSSAFPQQGNPGLLHGYYAPVPVPSRNPSKAARSTRHSQHQSQPPAPSTQPQETQQ